MVAVAFFDNDRANPPVTGGDDRVFRVVAGAYAQLFAGQVGPVAQPSGVFAVFAQTAVMVMVVHLNRAMARASRFIRTSSRQSVRSLVMFIGAAPA